MAQRLTQEALLEGLDADLAWRRLELSALKTAILRAHGPARETAGRSAVALSYAHWEGYIVQSGRALLRYVADQRLRYEQLSDAYMALCLSGRLTGAELSTTRIQRHIDAVVALRKSHEQAVLPSPENAVSGEGNLKAAKFEDLVMRLGLDPRPFELSYVWLDTELLRRRNRVSHGEMGYADTEFAIVALETVNRLLDSFRTAVSNAAVLAVYKRTT